MLNKEKAPIYWLIKKRRKEMKREEKVVYRGVGFIELLTVAFIVLKLMNVINWSWIWVLSPIWISVTLDLFTLLIIWLYYLYLKK